MAVVARSLDPPPKLELQPHGVHDQTARSHHRDRHESVPAGEVSGFPSLRFSGQSTVLNSLTSSRTAASELSIGQSENRPSRVFRAAVVLSGLLVVMFLRGVPTPVQWGCAVAILACGLYLAISDPVLALALLPSALIIGPVTRLVQGGLGIHLGDAYIMLTGAAMVFRHGPIRPVQLGRYHRSVFCGLFLVAVSWVLALDRTASTPTVVSISEMVLVYFLTINVVQSRADIQRILDGWILGLTFGSILVIVSYLQRTMLILGADEAAKRNVDVVVEGERSLFRASYFVAGFYHPQACAIVSIVTRLLFPLIHVSATKR